MRNSTAALKGKFTLSSFLEILNKAPCLTERSEKSSRPSPVQLVSPQLHFIIQNTHAFTLFTVLYVILFDTSVFIDLVFVIFRELTVNRKMLLCFSVQWFLNVSLLLIMITWFLVKHEKRPAVCYHSVT